jgi:hypothetical protein
MLSVPCLHIYITTWVHSRSRISDHLLTSLMKESSELAREKIRRVGVPRPTPPLITVLSNLFELNVSSLSVNVVTNAKLSFDLSAFNVRRVGLSEARCLQRVVDAKTLDDPFMLSWEYKKLLAEDVLSGSADCLYLYLEHDQLFTQTNLDYYLEHAANLSREGLAPGFLRVEWSSHQGFFVATDQARPTNFESCAKLESGEVTWVDLANPYSGISLMSHERAISHLSSASASELESRRLVDWGISERAAMCDRLDGERREFDNHGRPWKSRTPIPFDSKTLRPLGGGQVWHLSNRYASKSHIGIRRGFGSLALDKLLELPTS